MTSFCIWTIKNNEYKGFLSKKMADAESLIKTAVRYVSFSEWVGAADVKFDVTFREEEFRFATAGASLGELLTGFPPITGNPDFKVTDRPDRDLTDAQRRDFAIRSLLTLDFDLSTDIAE
ncbi:hypothetical protein SAMN05216555_10954 [Arthrobacter cupressi]|uniref:Uncharacterized protein n=2 Tax=Arthrobacter cupressi TaxID=1045773 RepID=A0A1G8SKZ2_9MICC|nr:hypothetical protein SAMN05216555_10954 [Arthrobacter cupressi]